MAWLPAKKVLFPGDNYYPAFPNLYTIRGSAPREVTHWIDSLDMMRTLPVEYLVPSHAEPVVGADRVYELLTAYRDAIQYVHDAVLRGANQGKNPDELVAEIELPPHLAAYPELMEFYGQISFSIRSMYDRYLGWFDGNATNLDPLPHWERAEKIAAMVGGVNNLVAEAEKALQAGEYQWAAELADMILAVDSENESGREIKIEALLNLGPEAAHNFAVEDIFRAMAVKLDPVASANSEMAATFHMTDTGCTYSVIVRRGVAEILKGDYENADLVVHVEENTWKELAAGTVSPTVALATGKLRVEDFKYIALNKFMNYFSKR